MSKPTVEEFAKLLDEFGFQRWKSGEGVGHIDGIEATERANRLRDETLAVFSRALTDERPRPVVKLKDSHAFIEGSMVGTIVNNRELSGYYVYLFSKAYDDDGGTFDHCRTWLITKLREAGFDVEEAK